MAPTRGCSQKREVVKVWECRLASPSSGTRWTADRLPISWNTSEIGKCKITFSRLPALKTVSRSFPVDKSVRSGLFGMPHKSEEQKQIPMTQPSRNVQPRSCQHVGIPRYGSYRSGLLEDPLRVTSSDRHSQPYLSALSPSNRKPNSYLVGMLGGVLLGAALIAAVKYPWTRPTEKFANISPKIAATTTDRADPEVIVDVVKTATPKVKRKTPLLPLNKAEADKLIRKWQVILLCLCVWSVQGVSVCEGRGIGSESRIQVHEASVG